MSSFLASALKLILRKSCNESDINIVLSQTLSIRKKRRNVKKLTVSSFVVSRSKRSLNIVKVYRCGFQAFSA